MRGFRSTLILLLILVGLGAYIYFVDSKKEPDSELASEKKDKAFSVEADKIEELNIKGSTGTTSLKKTGGKWEMTAPEATAADESEVSGITSNIASLEIQRVVEENPTDLKEFGLVEPKIDLAFKAAGDKDFKHLLIGDKTGTGGDLYAKFPDKKRVFLISSYLESTFNKATFDLRDKSILKFDRDKIDAIDLTTSKGTVSMARSSGEWRVTAPVQARGDYGTIEGIVSKLQSSQMKSIIAPSATDLKAYGLDKPGMSVTLKAGSSTATLTVGKAAPDGHLYSHDASRPMIFAIDKTVVDDMSKPPDDFRRKDLFEFRSFNANRIDIARGHDTLSYEKVKGTEKDATEKWRQVAPAAKDVDQGKMDGLLSKLSNLRALSFVEAKTQTALASPAAVVTVKFDENKKQEQVSFGRVGTDVFAGRKDEPGAAKLDAAEFDGALKALDELK
jgi:hypothetical protein